MKTRNIFVDTQAFMRQCFRFEGAVLKRIEQLGKDGLINILISEVVSREVKSKLAEQMDNAYQSFRSMQKNLEVLESASPLIDFSIDIRGLKGIAESRWDKYLLESKATILSSNDICNSKLLEYYFGGTYPFSEGKKKSEFPDAISVLSLQSWLNRTKEAVYVISQDKDLKGFCEGEQLCISLEKISEFIDIYNQEEEKLSESVRKYIEDDIDWLTELIKTEYLNKGFVYDGNYEAEVGEVVVEKITIQEIDIIEVESKRAVIECSVVIKSKADISGPDYENAIWDSEDKEYFYIGSFDACMSFEDVHGVSVELYLNEEEGGISEVSEIIFEDGSDITLHYEDDFPYK